MEQSTFQPGVICLECQQQGLNNRLRTFFIDLNEQIVKCESSSCLYPYENDFSNSDDAEEGEVKALSSYSNTDGELSSNDITIHNNYDYTDSVHFVDSLLSIDHGSYSSGNIENVTLFSNQPALPKSRGTLDITIAQSFSLKSETLASNSCSNKLFDVTEGVSFIDALFSDCKTDHLANGSIKTSVEIAAPRTNQSASCNMPILGFDFGGLMPSTEQQLATVKKEQICKIEIEKGQVDKSENLTNSLESWLANDSKPLEFIKNENPQKELDVPAPTFLGASSSTSTKLLASKSENRISRYFKALRETQEKLEKCNKTMLSKKRIPSNKKPLKKKQQKSEAANKSNLENLLQLLRTKKKI